jgi:putative ABC transport system permease protein
VSRFVAPRYLATVRIPLVRGRDFTPADVAGAERVAIVSESFAERAWPNRDPIGMRFTCCDNSRDDPRWRTVVGVVGDVRADGPTAGLRPQFYLPVDQMPVEAWGWTGRSMTVVARMDREDDVRVADVMAAIRAAVRSVDSEIPVYRMRPMRDLVRGSTAEARFNTLLLGLLGAVGLALAMVGIYGVVGYVVEQRTREIGVRMALGATPGDVVRLLAIQGTGPILLGIGVGTALAFAAMRLLRTAVYGVSLTDPTSLAGAAALLFVAGLTAALVPARRATRVDPARTIMRG